MFIGQALAQLIHTARGQAAEDCPIPSAFCNTHAFGMKLHDLVESKLHGQAAINLSSTTQRMGPDLLWTLPWTNQQERNMFLWPSQ